MARRLPPFLAALLLALTAAGADLPALEKEFADRCRAMLGERIPGTKEDVLGREGWILLATELRFASVGRFFGPDAAKAVPRVKPEVADPIPAIVDFAEQLEARGITLIFMPVPVRPLIYPESVLGAERLRGVAPVPYLFSDQAAFVAALRERGVRVIDLTPVFLAHRDDPHAPIFVPSESHWTGFGTYLAAREVAAAIRGEPWLASAAKADLSAEWEILEHSGHIYRDIHEKGGLPPRPPDRLFYRRVELATPGGPQPLSLKSPESPVVVMGDSNTIWWRDRGGSFPHQLAYELRLPVDVQATTGGGPTNSRLNLIRTAQANPGYLASKKLVVWCFSSRSTTEGTDGWPRTPIDPPPTPTPAPPGPAQTTTR